MAAEFPQHGGVGGVGFSWELREGRLRPDAGVPLSDRGFRYGQHFFETLPVRGGQWQFYSEHLHRIMNSAREAGFPPLPAASAALLPGLPGSPEFAGWPYALVRLYWTAGDGPPAAPPAAGRFYISMEPMEPETAPRRLRLVQGVGICGVLPGEFSSCPQPGTAEATSGGSWKTGNYWAALQVLARARAEGADEALRFNATNKLVGACLGNVFYRKNAAWWTPPLEDGPRHGVVRGWLLEQGFAREASLHLEEARHIKEWLVCNSRLGPCPAHLSTEASPEIAPEIIHLWEEFHHRR